MSHVNQENHSATEQKLSTATPEQAGVSRRRFLSTSSKVLATTGLVGGGAVSSLLAACGDATPAQTSGPATVTYTFDAFAKLPDAQMVADAMSATPQCKNLNIKVSLNPIDSASYDQKLQLGYAAGQPYDLVFTAPWVNNYTQNAIKGNFLALDDLLPKYAPELYSSMPTAFWDAVRVNGKIYGIPNQNYFAYVMGVFIVQSYADKYKKYIPAKLNSYADMEPFLAAVKADNPNSTPFYQGAGIAGGYLFTGADYGLDVFSPSSGIAGIRYNDKNLRVLSIYESDEYKQAVALRWRWQQMGFCTTDTISAQQGAAQVQAGQYAMLAGQQAKPNDIPTVQEHFGVKLLAKTVGTPFLTTDGLVQNMNSIVRTSPHPDKVLQFANLVNTDPTIFNLLCHGIENKHYVFVDKAQKLIDFPKGVTAVTDGYNPSSDWMFGNEQNGYYTDPGSVGIFANIQKANNSAARSAAFGFAFDPTNVKTQIAQVSSITSSTGSLTVAFGAGKVSPNDLANYISQIKQAGSADIIAEAQKQLDAWAAKHK